MKKNISKNWEHGENEEKIYEKWESSGYFKPEIDRHCEEQSDEAISKRSFDGVYPESIERAQDDSEVRLPRSSKDSELAMTERDKFVIMMPPPNVTGKLHIGHALFVTLEDIMTRYHRLIGDETLWLPGIDHAGIATQTVVDKALRKEGINRREIGREKFVEKVWQWKEKYGGEITNQIRRLGASCDWSRERFTLDKGLSEAVNEAFTILYNRGLIYRGEYIVNWCPKCGTAIADDEVEY